IFLNLVLLGAEVDASASLPSDERLHGFYVLNMIIVALFVVEIALKFAAYTCKGFFQGSDRLWNIFDFSIVMLSVGEIIADVVDQLTSDGRYADSDI
ncbi:CACNA1C, partial [Symbiodinium natans]